MGQADTTNHYFDHQRGKHGFWKVMEKIGTHRVELTDKYYDSTSPLYERTPI